jgi:hypothetical protein
MPTQCSRNLSSYEAVEGADGRRFGPTVDATTDAGAMLPGGARGRRSARVKRSAGCFDEGFRSKHRSNRALRRWWPSASWAKPSLEIAFGPAKPNLWKDLVRHDQLSQTPVLTWPKA